MKFSVSTTRREVIVAIGLIPYHLYDSVVQLAFPWAGSDRHDRHGAQGSPGATHAPR